jgi:hypothetical protein
MIKKLLFLAGFLLAMTDGALAAEGFIKKLSLPSGQTVVVSEGAFEARSIGSFSVRLYAPAPAGDDTTFFVSGLVHRRDGFVEDVVLNDLSGDDAPEIIVIVRSVGTGSYLSAHAFTVNQGQALVLMAEVSGLQPDADPLTHLRYIVPNPGP